EPTAVTDSGGRYSFDDLANGSYDVRVAPDAAQVASLRGLVCSTPSFCAHLGETLDASHRAVVGLDFGIYAPAHLRIDKVTDPAGDSTLFGFTSALGNFQLTDAATVKDFDVAPGTYSVTESASSGWNLTGLSCSDGSNQSGSTVSVTLA